MPGKDGTGPTGQGSRGEEHVGGNQVRCAHGGAGAVRRGRRDGSGRGAGRSLTAVRAPALATVMPEVLAPGPAARVVSAGASALITRSRTVAVVEQASCIACGTCVETCPRAAIVLEETAVVDTHRCTGCGLCVDDCSYGALALTEV